MPDTAIHLLYERWLERRHNTLWLINTGFSEFLCHPDGGAYLQTHWQRREHLQMRAAGAQTLLPDQAGSEPLSQPTDIAWAWPKSKAEAAMVIAWLGAKAAPGSRLWVAGENHSGVRSAPAWLENDGWSVRKVGSMRRSTLFVAEPPVRSAPFRLENWFARFELPGGEPVCTLPGVFSHGRLDAGSAALLPWLGSHAPSGHLVDFGCGGGVISAALHSLGQVQKITALDADWLAVLSTRKTAECLDADWEILWSEGWQESTGPYDGVITNPPFHSGRATDYGITRAMLEGMPRHLNPGGQLLAVVNQHLPYQPWLDQAFRTVRKLQRKGEYVIWQAERPTSGH